MKPLTTHEEFCLKNAAHFVPTRRLGDGSHLSLGTLQFQALHLPGHMGCHMGFVLQALMMWAEWPREVTA